MSITQIVVQSPANEVIFNDTNITNAIDAIKSSSAKLLYVIIDNSANNAASYVKLYNLASGSVTVGTTVPDEVIYVPASTVITVPYYTGAAPGKTFGTALSAACVTTGGTAGTSAPADAVVLTASYI